MRLGFGVARLVAVGVAGPAGGARRPRGRGRGRKEPTRACLVACGGRVNRLVRGGGRGAKPFGFERGGVETEATATWGRGYVGRGTSARGPGNGPRGVGEPTETGPWCGALL